MYVSHPVRRMRTDPDPDRDARLVVERAGDGDAGGEDGDTEAADLAAVVAGLGGRVAEEGRFTTTVVVPETAVDDLCSTPGLARVETANTHGLAVEDVDVEGAGEDAHLD
jgi:hypothetical protein